MASVFKSIGRLSAAVLGGALAVGMLGASAHAGVLTGFNFDGISSVSPPATFNSTTNGPGVSGAVISYGAGMRSTNDYGNAFAGVATDSTDLAAAVTSNQYITFTVTPSAGSTLTATGLTAAFTGESTATGVVESAVTGFGSASGDILGTLISGGNSGNNNTQSVTLSSPVTFSTPTEFRVYVYGSSGYYEAEGFGSNTASDGVTDLALNGTTPEPATIGLLALGGLALLLPRRKGLRAAR